MNKSKEENTTFVKTKKSKRLFSPMVLAMNTPPTDRDSLTVRIQNALEEGKPEEAEKACSEFEKCFGRTGEFLFWKGRIAMKQSRWGEAISFFQQAENLDGHPAAAECRNMLNDILNFYHKDLYNP